MGCGIPRYFKAEQMGLIPQRWEKNRVELFSSPSPLSSLPPPGIEAVPIMGPLDRNGFVLTAELRAAEGFINTSFYQHLAAHKRHRQSAVFIRGVSSPKEIIVVF